MKIAIVSSEMVPFAKTGGLADVTGALVKELVWDGENEVIAFLPYYREIKVTVNDAKISGEVFVGGNKEKYKIFIYEFPCGSKIFLVQHPGYFDRDQLYGTPQGDYSDNDQRFIFFQKAILSTLKKTNFKPDIIHCHDWQSALVSAYIKIIYRGDTFFKNTRCVFTIHNLAYQGVFPKERFPLTSLDWSLFNLHALEFYGKTNFLKGGIVFSDAITTVSECYSREIQTEEFGCGLDGVLKERSDSLFGILNGIDYETWDPERDPLIKFNYSLNNLDGKWKNKEHLQIEQHLPVGRNFPLIGMVTRLADQKGLDILSEVLEELFKLELQMIILGTGDEKYHKLLRNLADKLKDRLSLNIKFDNRLAHQIYASSDIFLMPSRYEPCGLGQMISFRYGTVPLVRETGGLDDTVIDVATGNENGNGFSFSQYSGKALLEKIKDACEYFRSRTESWREIMERGMREDFSWRNSTRKYLDLFRRLLGEKLCQN